MKAGIFSHHYKNTQLIVNNKISFLTGCLLCIYFLWHLLISAKWLVKHFCGNVKHFEKFEGFRF